METNEKIFELLEQTGLNWTVNRIPLIADNGLKTESFGIFRNDNNQWLGTVGGRYVEMQNHTLADVIIKASDGVGIITDRGGTLCGGKSIYLQAELPEEKIGKSGVKRLITAINSHDGTTSIGFGSTNTVITCSNTFYRAFGELQKFRHTESAERRIQIAMHDLKITLNLEKELMNNFKAMAEIKMEDEVVARVIKKIFSIDANDDSDKLSTRKKNQIVAFGGATQKSIQEQGNTVWALFNGVTRYTNHISAPSDEKLDYLMNGTGYKMTNDSYLEIMKWMNEKGVLTNNKEIIMA